MFFSAFTIRISYFHVKKIKSPSKSKCFFFRNRSLWEDIVKKTLNFMLISDLKELLRKNLQKNLKLFSFQNPPSS